MKNLMLVILGALIAGSARADIFYDWVDLPGGSGSSSGFMRLADANIADPGNFDVFFDPANVLEVQFTFSDGVSIADAVNFDPLSTLQNDPELNDNAHSLIATNGTISTGWSFLKGPGSAVLTYVQSTDENDICVVAPCGLRNTRITFTGPLIPRASGVGEWQLRAVPLPAPLLLLGAGIGVLYRTRRRTFPA